MKPELTPKKSILWKSTVAGILLYTALLMLANSIFGGGSSVYGNPHASLEEKNSCPDCHVGDVASEKSSGYRVVNFTKDVYSLCTSCHAPEIHHPVEISPGAGYAGKLPLDRDGEMTCTTCHDPHRPAYADEPYVGRSVASRLFDLAFPLIRRRYKTYFLREKNLQGEVCLECHRIDRLLTAKKLDFPDPKEYATSRTCKECHSREYEMWRITPHARMVQSPRDPGGNSDPAFFSGTDIDPQEVVFVLGSHWVNRFVSEKKGKLVVRKPIYIVSSETWNFSYWREFDWVKNCAGCHVTGFNPLLLSFAEKGVSCEACHGPGKKHSRTGNPGDIVNPSKLPADKKIMICESCHTTGHDRTGEYRYPAGYVPGRNLADYFFGLRPKPGQDDATFKNDGSPEDRQRQFVFWLEKYLYATKETCDLCKNFRFQGRNRGARTTNRYCTSCHGRTAGSPSPVCTKETKECITCHVPVKGSDFDFSIHDHKYVPLKVYEKIAGLPGGAMR